MRDLPTISPLGVGALVVNFGNEISETLNARAISLAAHFEKHPFDGFIEAVPAYSSVAVYYNVGETRRALSIHQSAYEAVKGLALTAMQEPSAFVETRSALVEIPVDFSDRAALDLDIVAEYSGLSRAGVVDRFTSKTYRVYMLGFLPGFAYMGDVDEQIAAPRRDTPRKRVPKGSVGIASRQTGIYPLESPGGWQIIGRTDVELFSPDRESPCALEPGDRVRFVPAV